jgi:hypothetical protein
MDRRATSPLVMPLAVLVFSLRADPDPRYAAR